MGLFHWVPYWRNGSIEGNRDGVHFVDVMSVKPNMNSPHTNTNAKAP